MSLKYNIIWNTLGTFIYWGCQWLITIFVVLLSDNFTNAGTLSLAISITNVIYMVSHYNIRQYQISDIKNKYANGTYISTRIITCVVSLIICVVFVAISSFDIQKSLSIVVYMIYKITEAFVDVYQSIDQRAFKMDIVGKSLIIRGLLTLISFIIILKYTGSLIYSIVGMVIVSLFVIFMYDIVQTSKVGDIKPLFNFKKIMALLIECFPIALGLLLYLFVQSTPRYILEKLLGSEYLGIYSSIATIALTMQVILSLIFNLLLPMYATYYGANNRKDFLTLFIKSFLLIVITSGVALVGAVMFGPWVLHLVFGGKIDPYAYLLVPIIGCASLNTLVGLLHSILIVMKKFHGMLIINVISVILCYFISQHYVYSYALNGVNYSLITIYVIQTILFLLFGIRGLYRKGRS